MVSKKENYLPFAIGASSTLIGLWSLGFSLSDWAPHGLFLGMERAAVGASLSIVAIGLGGIVMYLFPPESFPNDEYWWL